MMSAEELKLAEDLVAKYDKRAKQNAERFMVEVHVNLSDMRGLIILSKIALAVLKKNTPRS